ncbi:MAG TPA: tRNA (adenosine(37)-N6)-threonylcarbamoyltransferase complex transferase subunit TsaD [Acidimicrobiales bacterium]|nr:tRNA (adenosine(37)-N6)-threonylcarbamoyltransferase complex transferase subunit TsaD [Acidimicrobiales bacterium]
MSRTILGIETSCDETAAAVVDDDGSVFSSIVSSQIDLHAHFGGVVPELAGRAHLERIVPVVDEALSKAGLSTTPPVDAVAATVGPGLIGALLVGVSFAKALALAWKVPFVGVNHLEGHLYSALLEDREIPFPAVVLLVSGGHTLLVDMSSPGQYDVLGETVDDAAGEAFDKVGRYLGLSYPGGPEIERLASNGDPKAISFPRPMLNDGLEFSFSGLKTAVVRYVREHRDVDSADVAASFQAALVEVLVEKALRAAAATNARSICLAGGVAANGPLRKALASATERAGLKVFLPSASMCTDNAAMIAAAAHVNLHDHGATDLSQGAVPGLRLTSRHEVPTS